MQYKLYKNANNDTSNIINEVLKNRGIDDPQEYLNLNKSVLIPYENLDNINVAVELFTEHFYQKNKIGILVDSDPDGYCSAAMMYLYIKELDDEYPVEYILHKKTKAHGLSDDVTIADDIQLLIIPDASTNDVNECKTLFEKGINIIVLDHHEKEKDNPYATIVNNQVSNKYINKNLCGAGIVYKFLQALDDEMWNEFADNYLDLCALANISDVMDMRSHETRYLTDIGISNIKNKCFMALIKAQEYSLNGKINIHNIQWYITPILNGMIRIGSSEEKELLFKAFIEQDESFEYKKRATKDNPQVVIQESIYDRVARLCKNAKSRQDKQRDKSVKEVINEIMEGNTGIKSTIFDATGLIDTGLSGVVAIKIAEYFNKPCILLTKQLDEKSKKIIYRGSARNINNSPIENFKNIVNSTGVFNFAQGHANAFGVSLDINKKEEAINKLDNLLKNIHYDSTYKVDFILDVNKVNIKIITELSKMDDIICQGIEPPQIAVENICLMRDHFEIYGKNEDTVTFTLNDIKYIQFKCKEGNELYDFLQDAWDESDCISFNLIGEASINDYSGVKTPQVIIRDVEVINIKQEDW